MAKKPKPELEEKPEESEEAELEGEVEPLDLPDPAAPVEEAPKVDEPAQDPERAFAAPYFEEPAEYNHSFELDFILDVLHSEYDAKAKSVISRPSGATLLENTYKPILSSEGIGGIRRETVFSYQGKYFKIAASCSPDQDQRHVAWDYPLIKGENKQVMAQKVDPIQKTVTVYLPSTE